MKISIEKSIIQIKNQNDVATSFACSDKLFEETVLAYCKHLGVSELDFMIRTISSGQHVIVFTRTGYQVSISPIIALELSNRMILLNDKLKMTEFSTTAEEQAD